MLRSSRPNGPKLYKISQRPKPRKAGSFSFKTLAIASLAVASVILVGYAIFFTDFFTIKQIIVEPKESKFSKDIENHISEGDLVYSNNSLLFDYDNLKADLTTSFPKLEFKKVERDGINKIKIEFERKIPLARYCSTTEDQISCLYFDDYGEEMEVDDVSKNTFLLDIDDSRSETDIKTNINIVRNLNASLKDINITAGTYEFIASGLPVLNVYTKKGPVLIFDLNSSINDQIQTLTKTLETRIDQTEFTKLKYIDLQIPNRVYYK